MDVDRPEPLWDDLFRERATAVLEQAFLAAQLGMPSEDHETAVDSLRILLDALLLEHLAPDPRTLDDRVHRRAPIGVHWRRIVTTGVTHTFVLGGGFVQPDELLGAVEERTRAIDAGGAWSGRRRRGHGALVLRVADDLAVLDATTASGGPAGPTDMRALVDLVAFATIGAASEAPSAPGVAAGPTDPARGRWARSPELVAAAFGIPGATLVPVTRSGWMCDVCGCLFAGRVEGTVAHPDRFAPVGRSGPCDLTVDCACHAAPVQRDVR